MYLRVMSTLGSIFCRSESLALQMSAMLDKTDLEDELEVRYPIEWYQRGCWIETGVSTEVMTFEWEVQLALLRFIALRVGRRTRSFPEGYDLPSSVPYIHTEDDVWPVLGPDYSGSIASPPIPWFTCTNLGMRTHLRDYSYLMQGINFLDHPVTRAIPIEELEAMRIGPRTPHTAPRWRKLGPVIELIIQPLQEFLQGLSDEWDSVVREP